MIIYFIIGILVLILDIVTKHWASAALMGTSGIPVIDGFFHLTYVENSGVAFGMLQDKRIIFVTMSLFVVDFLDFRVINFPVFNIADMAVCIGAAALVIHFLTSDTESKDKLNEKKE